MTTMIKDVIIRMKIFLARSTATAIGINARQMTAEDKLAMIIYFLRIEFTIIIDCLTFPDSKKVEQKAKAII